MAEVDKLAVSEGLQYTSCQCNEQMETTLDDEKTAPMTSAPHDATSAHMYDVDSSDPHSQLVDRAELSSAEVAHIGTLMKALSDLRDTERALSDASQTYMKLSAQDMRALHFLIVAKNRGELVQPGTLSSYLNISKASTTKLLNRLEIGGHIERQIHPTDRRSLTISVTSSTEASAMNTVGKHQATRFQAAARLSEAERDVVIRFLNDMREGLSLENTDWAKA